MSIFWFPGYWISQYFHKIDTQKNRHNIFFIKIDMNRHEQTRIDTKSLKSQKKQTRKQKLNTKIEIRHEQTRIDRNPKHRKKIDTNRHVPSWNTIVQTLPPQWTQSRFLKFRRESWGLFEGKLSTKRRIKPNLNAKPAKNTRKVRPRAPLKGI